MKPSATVIEEFARHLFAHRGKVQLDQVHGDRWEGGEGCLLNPDAPDGQKPGCLPACRSHRNRPGCSPHLPPFQGERQTRTLPSGHTPTFRGPCGLFIYKERIPWGSGSSQASQDPSGSTVAGGPGPWFILTFPSRLSGGVLGIPTSSHPLEVKNYSSENMTPTLHTSKGSLISLPQSSHTFLGQCSRSTF